jgi:hypothetical protein
MPITAHVSDIDELVSAFEAVQRVSYPRVDLCRGPAWRGRHSRRVITWSVYGDPYQRAALARELTDVTQERYDIIVKDTGDMTLIVVTSIPE